jgi:phage baseplate assembly protein W
MPISEEEQLIAQNTVKTNLLEVIGQDIDFPLRFTDGNTVGIIPQSNAGERISDSIHLILATRIGERLFNPEFGSKLPDLVFEPNDAILKRLLVFYTSDALKRWEKRIEILNVAILDNLSSDGHTLGVHIQYRIRNSHIKGSYVYPFVREGAETGSLYTGVEATRMANRGQVTE